MDSVDIIDLTIDRNDRFEDYDDDIEFVGNVGIGNQNQNDKETIYEDTIDSVEPIDLTMDVDNELQLVPIAETDRTTEQEIDSFFSYEVLPIEAVVKHMDDCIEEVNHLIKIFPITTIRMLLFHFAWDKKKLMEKFCECDHDTLLAETKIVKLPQLSNIGEVGTSETEECTICYSTLPTAWMASLGCEHRYCSQCWCKYLTGKIKDEGMGHTITCMECRVFINDDIVRKHVCNPNVQRRYQYIIVNSFVMCNKFFRWCSAPDCSSAIKGTHEYVTPVTCECGHTFCFNCGENWHEPLSCVMFQKWITKSVDDSESAIWITSHTKLCPQCQVPIEKNGGCNNMVCGNPNCRVQFCWGCLDIKSYIAPCKCATRYQRGAITLQSDQSQSLRTGLQHYLPYWNAYMTNMRSLRLEESVRDDIKVLVRSSLPCGTLSPEEVFQKSVMDILCKCRQTVMYTYVLAYYLHDGNQSLLLKKNLTILEVATDSLSRYLHFNNSREPWAFFRQDIENMCSNCERHRNIVLNHVYEGYENNYWRYTL